VARLGMGSLTIALCATLPGCNLGAVSYNPCVKTSLTTVECTGDDASVPDTRAEAREAASDVRGEAGGGDGRTDAP